MILFGLLSKAIFAAGGLIAVFIVAWYFYIHDHAARTEGGVATSVDRVLDAQRVTCRERQGAWRCNVQRDTSDPGQTLTVVKAGKKNCWRLQGEDVRGCVKVLDYVRGVF